MCVPKNSTVYSVDIKTTFFREIVFFGIVSSVQIPYLASSAEVGEDRQFVVEFL
jgi:hypothetical protein